MSMLASRTFTLTIALVFLKMTQVLSKTEKQLIINHFQKFFASEDDDDEEEEEEDESEYYD